MSAPSLIRFALLAASFVALAACAEYKALDQASEGGRSDIDVGRFLSRYGACGDLEVWAANEGDTLALHFWIDGGVTDAAPEFEISSLDVLLPAEDAALTLYTGSNLSEPWCADGSDEETVVDAIYVPIDGRLTLQVSPNTFDAEWGPRVDLLIEEVLLEADDGDLKSLGLFQLWNVPVDDL